MLTQITLLLYHVGFSFDNHICPHFIKKHRKDIYNTQCFRLRFENDFSGSIQQPIKRFPALLYLKLPQSIVKPYSRWMFSIFIIIRFVFNPTNEGCFPAIV